jgi:hypothetical protein
MRFRVVTLNLEQDHKRWDERRPLVLEGLRALKPDIIALNEVSITRQSARGLQKDLASLLGVNHNLVQQTRVNSLASVEAEALLTRFAIVETGNLDYQTRDMVAQVTRILVDGRRLDVYVTHRRPQRRIGLHCLRRLQRDNGPAFRSANGEPIPPHPDIAHRLHTAHWLGWRDIPSQLATDGPMHRLYLDDRRNRDFGERRLLRSAGCHRPVTMAVGSCWGLGRSGVLNSLGRIGRARRPFPGRHFNLDKVG